MASVKGMGKSTSTQKITSIAAHNDKVPPIVEKKWVVTITDEDSISLSSM